MFRANADADLDLRFRYTPGAEGASTFGVAYVRWVDANNHLLVGWTSTTMKLRKNVSGTLTSLDEATINSDANTWYRVRVLCEGADVTVWRGVEDGPMEVVLSTTAAPVASTSLLVFNSGTSSSYAYDDIQVVADGWTSGTSFTPNNANELTSMSFQGVTTSFAYDGWGRMTSKSRGSYSASYGYKYGQMMTSVTSTFPHEGNVTYDYGGNFQRRERTVNSTTTQYQWDEGFDLVSEEDGSGNLTRTHTGRLGDVAGSNPASGTERYYHGDHLGSARRLTDGTGDTLAMREYDPYGASFGEAGAGGTWTFAMMAEDPPSGLLYAPFRYYSQGTSRWITPDPLGMVQGPNLYMYVGGHPTILVDPSGLVVDVVWDIGMVALDIICGNWGAAVFDAALAFVPFVPAGVGLLGKTVRKGKSLYGKAPQLSTPNSLRLGLYEGRSGTYPTITYYDSLGRQRVRTDYSGVGGHGNPHTEYFPLGAGPLEGEAPSITVRGSMRDLC